MNFPHGVTVTVQHLSSTDVYGDPTPGTTTDVTGCAVAPRSSSDIADRGRTGVIVGLTVYFPAGTTIVATDSFIIDGVLWRLDGEAGVWQSPFTGWQPGIECALVRGAG